MLLLQGQEESKAVPSSKPHQHCSFTLPISQLDEVLGSLVPPGASAETPPNFTPCPLCAGFQDLFLLPLDLPIFFSYLPNWLQISMHTLSWVKKQTAKKQKQPNIKTYLVILDQNISLFDISLIVFFEDCSLQRQQPKKSQLYFHLLRSAMATGRKLIKLKSSMAYSDLFPSNTNKLCTRFFTH